MIPDNYLQTIICEEVFTSTPGPGISKHVELKTKINNSNWHKAMLLNITNLLKITNIIILE